VVALLYFGGVLNDPMNLWHSLAYVSAATCFFQLFRLKRHVEADESQKPQP
jgi:hypothetical protein